MFEGIEGKKTYRTALGVPMPMKTTFPPGRAVYEPRSVSERLGLSSSGKTHVDRRLHASFDTSALHHDVESIRIDGSVALQDVLSSGLGRFESGRRGLGTGSARKNVARGGKALVDGKLDTLFVAVRRVGSAKARG